MGLGLMAPDRDALPSALAFPIEEATRPAAELKPAVIRALRRALMSRARQPDGSVPALFSGHEPEGGPAASGQHRHVYITASERDGRLNSLTVIAPWLVDRTVEPSLEDKRLFADSLDGITKLLAGVAGVLDLQAPHRPTSGKDAFAIVFRWSSATPYVPTRRGRRGRDWSEVVRADIEGECERRGLPRPKVTVTRVTEGRGGGAEARAVLEFAKAVPGPIILGRTAHRGGGLFVPA